MAEVSEHGTFIEINGVKVWHRVTGDGPEAVIQLHGAGFGHYNTEPCTPVLADHFKVVDWDLRGYGQSDKPSQKYDMEVWADDTAALMDKLGIERAHIHGTSMGGMIAQIIAGRHPQRTLSLTSIFSSTGSRKVGQLAMSSMLMLIKPPARTRDEAVQRYSAAMAHIGTQTYPVNDAARRAYAADAWDRGQQAKDAEGIKAISRWLSEERAIPPEPMRKTNASRRDASG